VQFYAKCSVLVLIGAVPTAHLYCYDLQQSDATPRCPRELTALPQTSWLDFGERKGWETGKRRKESARGKNISLHPFNGPLSGTTRVSRYQEGKTNLDFTEARDSEWQWHQLGHMHKSAPRSRQTTMPAPHHSVFLQAGCPSCCPTNSVKALRAKRGAPCGLGGGVE